ncbi:MAG: hypothetical protein M1826_001709 [Phylliscum demangeonii]|nr:MAG: hypothetical protein M1826_001709 [Phylliscum demangeonii]
MADSVVYKHFIRALNRWPKDLLRPEASFPDAMRRRLDQRLKPTATDGPAVSMLEHNAEAELEQVNALYSLLEDRYRRKHPVSEAFMKPASNPNHYTALLAELEAAPKRSWLASRLNKWRGFLRFR